MNSAAEAPDNDESHPKRSKRGASFPRMTLAEAVGAIQQAMKMGRHHNQGSLASALGHSSVKSSTYRQRLADLREYGLVAGRGDDLELTDLAQRITHPISSSDAESALGAAFLHCDTFTRMYDELNKGEAIPLDRLGNVSIHKLEVSQHSADRFAESFAAGAVTARIAERTDLDIILWERERSQSPPAEQVTPEEATKPTHSAPEEDGRSSSMVDVLKQAWPLTNGEVRFSVRLTDALPSSAFGPLGEAASAIEALVVHLGECFPEEPLTPTTGDEG